MFQINDLSSRMGKNKIIVEMLHYYIEYTLIDNGSQLVVLRAHLIFECSILIIMMEMKQSYKYDKEE